MKNVLRTLIVCGVIALIGAFTPSCTPTPDGGAMGNPSFEITGEAVVNNAVSVDIPVKAQNLEKIGCYVREIFVDEKGDKYFVSGYDSNKNPILAGQIADPTAAIVFRKGKIFEGGESINNLHLSGNEGLDRNKTFIVYIAAIANNKYYNNGQIFSVEFKTPEKYADDDVAVIRQSYEGMDVYLTFPPQVKAKNRRVKWGVSNIATLAYYGNPPIPQQLHNCDFVYPAFLVQRDTLLEINHYNAYRRNAKGEIGYYVVGYSNCVEVSKDSPDVESGAAGPIQYYYEFQPGEPLVLLLSEVDYADCDLGNYEEGANADHKIESCDKKHPIINWGWGKGWKNHNLTTDCKAFVNGYEFRGDPIWAPIGGVYWLECKPFNEFDPDGEPDDLSECHWRCNGAEVMDIREGNVKIRKDALVAAPTERCLVKYEIYCGDRYLKSVSIDAVPRVKRMEVKATILGETVGSTIGKEANIECFQGQKIDLSVAIHTSDNKLPMFMPGLTVVFPDGSKKEDRKVTAMDLSVCFKNPGKRKIEVMALDDTNVKQVINFNIKEENSDKYLLCMFIGVLLAWLFFILNYGLGLWTFLSYLVPAVCYWRYKMKQCRFYRKIMMGLFIADIAMFIWSFIQEIA